MLFQCNMLNKKLWSFRGKLLRHLVTESSDYRSLYFAKFLKHSLLGSSVVA